MEEKKNIELIKWNRLIDFGIKRNELSIYRKYMFPTLFNSSMGDKGSQFNRENQNLHVEAGLSLAKDLSMNRTTIPSHTSDFWDTNILTTAKWSTKQHN